jgi:CRISPR-associated endonuclease Cas3-HD
MKKEACSFTNETLKEHSIKTLEYGVEKFFSQQPAYVNSAVFRLNQYFKLDPPLTPDKFKEACSIACYLHDIGKAADIYQKQFIDGCTCKYNKDPSFSYHEILSAIIVERYFRCINTPNDKISILITLAVLNHMHAIRPYSNSQKVLSELRYKQPLTDSFSLDSTGIEEFLKAAPPSINKDCLSKNSERITLRDVQDFLQKIDKAMKERNKLYTLILVPVVVGDNLAASEARKDGGRRLFVEELRRLIEN